MKKQDPDTLPELVPRTGRGAGGIDTSDRTLRTGEDLL